MDEKKNSTAVISQQEEMIKTLKATLEVNKERQEVLANMLERAVKLIEMKNGDTYFIGMGYIDNVIKSLRGQRN